MVLRKKHRTMRKNRKHRGGTGKTKRGEWIYKWFCIVRNGLEQCIRGHKKENTNNDYYEDEHGYRITKDYVPPK